MRILVSALLLCSTFVIAKDKQDKEWKKTTEQYIKEHFGKSRGVACTSDSPGVLVIQKAGIAVNYADDIGGMIPMSLFDSETAARLYFDPGDGELPVKSKVCLQHVRITDKAVSLQVRTADMVSRLVNGTSSKMYMLGNITIKVHARTTEPEKLKAMIEKFVRPTN